VFDKDNKNTHNNEPNPVIYYQSLSSSLSEFNKESRPHVPIIILVNNYKRRMSERMPPGRLLAVSFNVLYKEMYK
jgi:hypothetical protein